MMLMMAVGGGRDHQLQQNSTRVMLVAIVVAVVGVSGLDLGLTRG